jgi:hypothetical protein
MKNRRPRRPRPRPGRAMQRPRRNMSEESSGRNGNRDFPGAGGEGRGAAWPGVTSESLIPMRDRCESLDYLSPQSKCSVGALACDCMKGGQPRAAVLHETFAEVSSCAHSNKKSSRSVGAHRVCVQPEGGHMGPPLQKINYLYDRKLGIRLQCSPGSRGLTALLKSSLRAAGRWIL